MKEIEPESVEESQPESVAPRDEVLRTYRSLSLGRRATVAACCLFVVLHLSTALVKGIKPSLRTLIWPAFSWYGDGLRMAASWGMFGAAHKKEALFSVGVTHEGVRHALYPWAPGEATLSQRILDVRVRKIQSQLKKRSSDSQWGKAYANYWCEHPPAGIVFDAVVLERADGPNPRSYPRKHFLTVKCSRPGGLRP